MVKKNGKKKWEEEGINGLFSTQRTDKGQHRIDQVLVDFIKKQYIEGNRGGTKVNRSQIAVKAQVKAKQEGLKVPSHMTVYRILQTIIDEQAVKKNIRNPGWKGTKLSLRTKDGTILEPEYSNHVWQCDHTEADILLVDSSGKIFKRPWLTTVIDTYSRCIVGINLGFDAPSSMVVGLALRHAILPKDYPSDYQLHEQWGTYGKPEYIFTDSGTDFKSHHVQQIASQLGITWKFRSRPSEGGIVERPFGTINTQLLSTLPGYTGSNIKERPKEAEKGACLTLNNFHKLVVRYIVNNYNQSLDKRTGQTRYQRWEAGLAVTPSLPTERELDLCLMKQTRRTVYQGVYISFNNLSYKGEYLSGYGGEQVILRYEPSDITTIYVYKNEGDKEVFLCRAFAQDLESESLSFYEAKEITRQIREKGKSITNNSILAEVQARELIIKEKKSKKQIQKEEHNLLKEQLSPLKVEPIEDEENLQENEPDLVVETEGESVNVYDYNEMIEEYGW
ncbi:Tn552 transposase [Geminocystis sp. NIES-3708]|uniref:Mu transposase C-terminal domain-containing protein n=1 Tax=Geminocystis sp. NIES-3708 TaxID=1615909 RepID=UPI0005FC453A|nr:Mu transposase C-terminal domain-containing protein [Geminocystis sp. NIES-3708]BAQ62897.1 Tn552 transposase [Geminocystis sp. NIES-3708]